MVLTPEFRQVAYAMACEFNIISNGMAVAFSSILMPALRDVHSDLKMDETTLLFIASIPLYSGFVMVLLLGPIMQQFGRRIAHFVYVLPVLIGWIICALSYSKLSLIIGLLCLGISNGGVFFMAVCIGELTKPSIRGIMLNVKQLFFSFGSTILHGSSYYLHWRHIAFIGAAICVIALILTYLWPESPDWLISKERYEEAAQSFYKIRGQTKEAEIEIKEMIAADIKRRKSIKKDSILQTLKHDVTTKAFWKSTALFICILVTIECAGKRFFPTFAIEISQMITGETKSGLVYTLIIDSIGILASFVSFYLSRKRPRRSLILFSGFIAVSLLFLFCFLYFVNKSVYANFTIKLSSSVVLVLYFAMAFSTFVPVSLMLLGELIPAEYRAIGTTFDACLMSISSILFISALPYMIKNLNIDGTFLIFAIIITLSLSYMHLYLPETKDRTLHEIAEYFRGNAPKVPEISKDKDECTAMLDA